MCTTELAGTYDLAISLATALDGNVRSVDSTDLTVQPEEGVRVCDVNNVMLNTYKPDGDTLCYQIPLLL